jgi:hypothetical protein
MQYGGLDQEIPVELLLRLRELRGQILLLPSKIGGLK